MTKLVVSFVRSALHLSLAATGAPTGSRPGVALRASPRSLLHISLFVLLFASGAALIAPAAEAADGLPDNINSYQLPGMATGNNAPQRQRGNNFGIQTDPSGDASGVGANGNALPSDYDGSLRPANRPGDSQLQPLRRQTPPLKPSEFQRFVQTATGRLLPIFGRRFFEERAESSTPVDNIPVSADYTVGPGDEVILRTWGSIDVNHRSTVDRNGLLNLPRIGSFNVSGVKASDLEKYLRNQIGRLYTNFDLSASLGKLRGVTVFVVGPAMQPGVLTLSSQSTMLSAVVAAGGPASNGSMRKVVLRRGGKQISDLDIYAFLVLGDKSKDVQLAAGDVLVFQPVGAQVGINGALDTPAIYELDSPTEPVGEVLRYSGGLPSLANPARAQLERIDVAKNPSRFVEEFKLDATGLQKTVRGGDVLTLLPISPEFANAVTLRGHVAQPLRYPFKPGMRIHDLIPDRDALITPDFYRRKNLLVQITDEPRDRNRFDRRDERGLIRQNDGARFPNNRTGYSNDGSATDSSYRDGAAGLASENNRYDGSNDGSYRNERGADNYRDNDGSSSNSRDAGGRGARNDRNRDNADRRNDTRPAPSALFDDLNWDYAVIERLNLKDLTTQIIPFNLGKVVLQNDAANNLELKSGDVVTIYSQRDILVPLARQTRLVSLEGEVGAPGVYQLQPGDTLQSLLIRAGGFTPQAYVYGVDLSRVDTRKRQRENLREAIVRLEALSSVQAAREAANRRGDVGEAATTSVVSNAATKAQLARLSSIEPNGRIALELEPSASNVANLPDLPLESGDRIVVPPRPGFVTVAGAVVNSNAFVWKPGRTAGDYLRVAGTDEAAEVDNMFILRADGTVSHSGDYRGFFGGNKLVDQVMQPGDALIVPNQLDFETWGRAFIRNAKDFAQIFTGFGLGAAAINQLTK